MLRDERTDGLVRLPKDIPQLITTAFKPRELRPGLQPHTPETEQERTLPAQRSDVWTTRIAVATFALLSFATLVAAVLLMLHDKEPTMGLFVGLGPATLVAYLAMRHPG